MEFWIMPFSHRDFWLPLLYCYKWFKSLIVKIIYFRYYFKQTWIKFYIFRYFIQDKIREYIKFFRILYCFVILNLILMIIIKLYLTLSLLQIFSWTNYNCYVFHLFILSHLFLYEAASQLFVYIQQSSIATR